jgi:hypothetical protein
MQNCSIRLWLTPWPGNKVRPRQVRPSDGGYNALSNCHFQNLRQTIPRQIDDCIVQNGNLLSSRALIKIDEVVFAADSKRNRLGQVNAVRQPVEAIL